MTAYCLSILDLCFMVYTLSLEVADFFPLTPNAQDFIFYRVFVVWGLCTWLCSRYEPIAVWGLRSCTAIFAVINLLHIILMLFPQLI